MRFKKPIILKLQFLLIGISLTLLSSCITPLDVEPSDFEDLLVVDGFITDDFGPHDFRITQVAKFASIKEGGTVSIIEGANVRIIDQTGQSILLERVKTERKELIPPRPGCFPITVSFVKIKTDYRTPESFKGKIGDTYYLEITTKEGRNYHSTKQTINSTPVIETLDLRFKKIPNLDPVTNRSGVEVFASWQDPVEEENFYFWRINGIYKIFTPDDSDGTKCCIYDPRDGGAEDCWIFEHNIRGNELAFSDQMVNGSQVKLPIGFIEDDGLRFADKLFVPPNKQYYLEVEQYSIPEEAFKFYDRIKTLREINGEIFDPPALSIGGNIFNIDDPNEVVVGYFGAYSVQKKSLFIERSLLDFIQRNPRPCGDCRLRSGAQTEIPEPYK